MLITNGPIVTWGSPNDILEGHALLIRDGKIAAIGLESELRTQYPDETILDAENQIIMPGNICAHTHFLRCFFRAVWLFLASSHQFC